MKKYLLLLVFIALCSFPSLHAQTLVGSFPFPQYNSYNYFWGVTVVNDTFWVSSQYSSSPGTYTHCWIYKVTRGGQIVDSIQTPLKSINALEWDGSGFWISEGFRSVDLGSRIYKMNRQGVLVDSFYTPSVIGGPAVGIGDLALDGHKMWFTVFNPDFTSYPNGYAYAFDLTSKAITDTMPLRGRQVVGLTFRGDTAFYVNDKQYSGDHERIYAYSRTLKDTIFSFASPDPDGDCKPEGICWDGQYLWLMADRIGGSAWSYRTLYKYSCATQGSPIISTNANSFNFNEVVIGGKGSGILTISNTGTANLEISSFEFNNSVFAITPSSVPDIIPAGGSKNYTLDFSPTVYDSAFGTLSIHSNDGGTPVKVISLKGKGIYSGAYINSSETTYNYGTRRSGSNCAWYVDIENRGSAALNINSFSTSTQTFVADTTGLSYPLTIMPQKSHRFRIWFRPQAAITYSDSILINSDASNEPSKYVMLSGSGNNQSTALGDKLWEAHIPDNPYGYQQDYKPMSMKRIDDVNGDGINDFILADRGYLVVCYNGNSSVQGDVLWTFNTGTNNYNTGSVMFEDALQIRSDIDGDGVQDVVFGCGGGNEFVYTVSGRTGKLIWAYGDSINYDRGDINGIRTDKDYNNDGIPDVLLSASGSTSGGRHSAICLDGKTGEEIWVSVQNAQATYDILNLQSGGAICVDVANNGTYKLNAFNNYGGSTWSITPPEVLWSIREINDINGDGIKDIAAFAGGLNVKTFVMSGANGQTLWMNSFPLFATFSTMRVISDLNNNGYSDIIYSGKEGVRRTDTKDGTILWTNMLDNSYVFGTDELGDLNADGVNEIAAGTKNSNLYVLNGATGAVMYEENFGDPIDYAVQRVIKLNSIDNNSLTEFAASTTDGRVIVYSGGTPGVTNVKPGTSVPLHYELSQNYPNPFNPATKISYSLKENGLVKLCVYNILGQIVRELVNKDQSAGTYTVDFNASGLSSGVYLYKIEVIGANNQASFTSTKKLILMK